MYGKCIHCQCMSVITVNTELVKVCTWGPPQVSPIIEWAKTKNGIMPEEIGRWTGRPPLNDDEGCFQFMPKMGVIEGGKKS